MTSWRDATLREREPRAADHSGSGSGTEPSRSRNVVDYRVPRREPAPEGWTRFDWLVLAVMVALNLGLLAYRVTW